jgi:hypothetical protein
VPTLDLIHADVVDGLSVGGAEVTHDRRDVGEEQESVRGEVQSDAGGGEVLVDHGLHTPEVTVRVLGDRCPSSTTADDDPTGVEQALHGVLFDDAQGLRGGDDATPAGAVGAHLPAVLWASHSASPRE